MGEWFAWAGRRDNEMAQRGGWREHAVVRELMLARVGQDGDEAFDEREGLEEPTRVLRRAGYRRPVPAGHCRTVELGTGGMERRAAVD